MKKTSIRKNEFRENETKNPKLKKTNFEIEEILFEKIKLERQENFISQKKLVNELLKLGFQTYQTNKFNI